jgi:uncharacterized coiled-coil protein SlyX
MADKMSCPACDARTSSVLTAFEDGNPCPHCELPWIGAQLVLEARRRGADEDLVTRLAELETKLAAAEAEGAKMRRQLDHIRQELEETT